MQMKKILAGFAGVLTAALLSAPVMAAVPHVTEFFEDREQYFEWVDDYKIPDDPGEYVFELTSDKLEYEIGDNVEIKMWYFGKVGPNTGVVRLLYDTDSVELIETEQVATGSGRNRAVTKNPTPFINYDQTFGDYNDHGDGTIDFVWLLPDNGPASNEDAGEPESTGVLFAEFTFKIKDTITSAEQVIAIDTDGRISKPPYDPNTYFVQWMDDGIMTYSKGIFLPYTAYPAEFTVKGVTTKYIVNFSLGDHAAKGAVAPASITWTEGDPGIILPEAPAAANGYVFDGWKVGDSLLGPGIGFIPTAKTTVVAQWRELAKYNITYADGGHGTLSRTSEVITEGNKVKLPAALAEVGYSFLGWSDGTTTYAPLAEVAVSSDMTFTAAWKAYEYNVTFALGDHAAEGTQAPAAVVYEYGTPALVLPAAPAAAEGYEFVGWSNGTALFNAGASFTPTAATNFTAIWQEEGVALITPKAVYNEYNDDYTVELYFSGVKADNVAFGFDYDKAQLQFVSFAPAEGLDTFNVGGAPAFEVNTEGHYENAVLLDQEGIVAGKCIDAVDEPVLLGKLTFKYIGAAEFKTEDSATRFYGASVAAKKYVSNGTSYVYIPAGTGLEVIEKPVVIDPVEETISDVPVFTLTGILGVARESGAAKAPAYATIFNLDGSVYADDVLLETEETVSDGGDVAYTLEIAAGGYSLVVKKNGYLVSDIVEFKAVENGTIERIDLVPGDIKNSADAKTGDGKIDLADFVRVVRGFDVDNALTDDEVLCVDINEDGVVTIADLAFVKANYGATAAEG